MSQGQGPKSQIGGGVGYGTEGELNCFDHLMNEYLTEGVVTAILRAKSLKLLIQAPQVILSLLVHIVA